MYHDVKHTANGVFDFSPGWNILFSTQVEVFMWPKKISARDEISTQAEFQLVYM